MIKAAAIIALLLLTGCSHGYDEATLSDLYMISGEYHDATKAADAGTLGSVAYQHACAELGTAVSLSLEGHHEAAYQLIYDVQMLLDDTDWVPASLQTDI